jgi:hypothetical protein
MNAARLRMNDESAGYISVNPATHRSHSPRLQSRTTCAGCWRPLCGGHGRVTPTAYSRQGDAYVEGSRRSPPQGRRAPPTRRTPSPRSGQASRRRRPRKGGAPRPHRARPPRARRTPRSRGGKSAQRRSRSQVNARTPHARRRTRNVISCGLHLDVYVYHRPRRSWGKSALIIGGSAGTGAGIGGIGGGKKGALIGAALGGGVGSLYEGAHRR